MLKYYQSWFWKIKVLISNALIDSSIGPDKFVSINNLPKEFDDKKERIKNSSVK